MNDLNTATMPHDTIMMEAQEGVDLAIIEITAPTEYPGLAKTGEVVTFTILEHSGEGHYRITGKCAKKTTIARQGCIPLPPKVRKSKKGENIGQSPYFQTRLFPKCVIFLNVL